MAKKKDLSLKDFHEGTIDDIIKYSKTFEGKPFKERIQFFESFHDLDKHMEERIGQHAEYVIRGKPTDSSLPGAYNLAYKKLDEAVKGDYDKVKGEHLDATFDALVDEMLGQVLGKDRLSKAIEKLKKKGFDDERIRRFKGSLFATHFKDDKNRPINIYGYKEVFKGKKKVEVISGLRGIAGDLQKSYTRHLKSQMTDHLVTDYDRLDIAPYVEEKFDKAGLHHPDIDHLELEPDQTAGHYETLIKHGDLGQQGYRKKKEKAA
jgi:hypothetical protein